MAGAVPRADSECGTKLGRAGWEGMDALVPDDLWAAVELLLPTELEKPKGGWHHPGAAHRPAVEAPPAF